MKSSALLLTVLTVSLPHELHAGSIDGLLGKQTAIQCYQTQNDVRCRNLATNKDWKVFTRSGNTVEGHVGGLNRSGDRIVCNDGRRIAVVNTDGSNHAFVAPKETSSGHFWRDSQGHDWVVYLGEMENKSQAGTTWRVKIDKATNKPIESTREKIADQQYSAGLGGSGQYLVESYGKSYLKNLTTKKKSPHLNGSQNCVGSSHAGGKPWMMYERDPNHHDVVISAWDEATGKSRYIWQYHHSGSEVYGHWSSTDERFATIAKNGQLYLVKVTVDTSGSGDRKGSSQEAAMGIQHGVVGPVWIGKGGCTSSGACDDGDPCTTDSCSGGACVNKPVSGCCTKDSQCDDGDACTTDTCAGNKCQHATISGCCTEDSQCDDGTVCTSDKCVSNTCQHAPVAGCCTSDGDCVDSNPCTVDSCDVTTGKCSNSKNSGCCAVDTDCDDGDPCTVDSCDSSNTCQHSGVCGDSGPPPADSSVFTDAGSHGPDAGPDAPDEAGAGSSQTLEPTGDRWLSGGCSTGAARRSPPPPLLLVGLILLRVFFTQPVRRTRR